MKLDEKQASDSLFGNLKKESKEKKKVIAKKETVNEKPQKQRTPLKKKRVKNRRLISVNTALKENHKDFLDSLSKKIMRSRSSKSTQENCQRITGNSILRSLLDCLLEREGEINYEEIDNEEALTQRLKEVLS